MVNREIKARKRAVKEEKEEIDGEIVRIRKGHPRTNLPVELPENPTWLKQPNVVTLMAGDFKTVQIRILIAVIEKLQNVIELSIQHLWYIYSMRAIILISRIFRPYKSRYCISGFGR